MRNIQIVDLFQDLLLFKSTWNELHVLDLLLILIMVLL